MAVQNQSLAQQRPAEHLGMLDGMRGFAALWVMVFHIYLLTLKNTPISSPYALVLGGLQAGHFAVNVFIVLSGFCLMLPVLKHSAISGGYLLFYKRRAARILPPLYAAFLTALVAHVATSVLTHSAITLDKKGIVGSLFLIQDLFPDRAYVLQALWSVDLEFKIYLIFPVLVYAFYKFGAKSIIPIATLSALLPTLFVYKRVHSGWELSSPWYYILFGMGVLSAVYYKKANTPSGPINFSIYFAAILTLPVVFFIYRNISSIYLPILDLYSGALFALLIPIILKSKSVISRLFNFNLLVKVGAFSYSLYLMHMIVIGSSNKLIQFYAPATSNIFGWQIVIGLLQIIFSLVFAMIFYRVVELPSLNLAKKLKQDIAAASNKGSI